MELFPTVNVRRFGVSKKTIASDLWKDGRWVFPSTRNSNLNHVWNFIDRNFVVLENEKDCIFWKPDEKGVFSVVSIWRSLI